jgi:hypothetical protein
LLNDLRTHFIVDAVDTFEFVIEEEDESSGRSQWAPSISRVVSWTLEDTKLLNRRKQQAEAEEKFRDASDKLAKAEAKLGVSADEIGVAMRQAVANARSGSPPTAETIDKNAAKLLRMAGHALDAADVKRVRRLVEVCRSDILPDHLRKKVEKAAPPRGNVVPFKFT